MAKHLILYHFEDNDGVCSAAIAKYYMLTELHYDEKDIILKGVNYNMLHEWAEVAEYEESESWLDLHEYHDILMTDISYNDTWCMKKMKDEFGSRFTWIDHHKPIIDTSIKEGWDDINGIRDHHHSAIVLMWKHLYDPFGTQEIPYILKCLSGWDSWSWEQYGLTFEEVRRTNVGYTDESQLKVDWWVNHMELILKDDAAAKSFNTQIFMKGSELCKKDDDKNEKMCETVGDMEWTVADGHTAIMVVLYGASNSIMFRSMKGRVEHAIVARRTKEGNWTISLYNIDMEDTFDCGYYLKNTYHGGGHVGAAGCTLSEEQFIHALQTKHI